MTWNQRMVQPPFSMNGLSFLVANPFRRTSLELFSSMNVIMSRTHSETGFLCMLNSTRSCSTVFFCCATLDMVVCIRVERGPGKI